MIQNFINRILKYHGLKLVQPEKIVIPLDVDEQFLKAYHKSKPFTMTTLDRMFAAYNAVEYVEKIKSRVQS